jgi:hypothetical protein
MGGHTRVDPPAHPHKDAFAVSVHPGSIAPGKRASNVAAGAENRGLNRSKRRKQREKTRSGVACCGSRAACRSLAIQTSVTEDRNGKGRE